MSHLSQQPIVLYWRLSDFMFHNESPEQEFIKRTLGQDMANGNNNCQENSSFDWHRVTWKRKGGGRRKCGTFCGLLTLLKPFLLLWQKIEKIFICKWESFCHLSGQIQLKLLYKLVTYRPILYLQVCKVDWVLWW